MVSIHANFDQDSNASYNDQVNVTLTELIAACKERIEVALVSHEQTLQKCNNGRENEFQSRKEKRKAVEITKDIGMIGIATRMGEHNTDRSTNSHMENAEGKNSLDHNEHLSRYEEKTLDRLGNSAEAGALIKEVQRDLKYLPYKVVEKKGKPYVEVNTGGKKK